MEILLADLAESLAVELAELRREVRASRIQAVREATKLSGPVYYHRSLRQVLETWIARGSGRQKVVCFACAAEHHIQLSLCSQEACHDVARDSPALNALFWASMRRLGSRDPV